jgi:hypothetical protein
VIALGSAAERIVGELPSDQQLPMRRYGRLGLTLYELSRLIADR